MEGATDNFLAAVCLACCKNGATANFLAAVSVAGGMEELPPIFWELFLSLFIRMELPPIF